MIKNNRILALILAVAALAGMLVGCGANPADQVVKNDGGTVTVPALDLELSFESPWFPVSAEEYSELTGDIKKLTEYVDDKGNLKKPYPEPSTGTELYLVNFHTLETCTILVVADDRDYSLEDFAASVFDQLQEEMFELSLPESCKIDGKTAYTIYGVYQDSMSEADLAIGEAGPYTSRLRFYYLHEKDTFVQINLTGFTDSLIAEELIED